MVEQMIKAKDLKIGDVIKFHYDNRLYCVTKHTVWANGEDFRLDCEEGFKFIDSCSDQELIYVGRGRYVPSQVILEADQQEKLK